MANFRADDADVVMAGKFTDTGTERLNDMEGTTMLFRFFGKQCDVLVNRILTGDQMTYQIDGGSVTTVNFAATGAATITVFTDTSDGNHDVVIRCLNSGAFRYTLTNGIQVTADGTADLLPHSSGYLVRRLSDTSVMTSLVTSDSIGSNKIYHTWETTNTSFGASNNAYIQGFSDQTIGWRGSHSRIAVFCRAGRYRLYRDGVEVGSTVAGNATYSIVEISTSEDSTEHEYKLICVSAVASPGRCYQLLCNGSFSATAPTLGRRIAFIGDSTTANTTSTFNSDQGPVSKFIGRTSLVCFNRGINGNSTATMDGRIATDTLNIPSLYAVVCVSGANDGAVADATLQASCESMYGKVLADDPATLCLVFEAWPSTAGNREGAVNLAAVTAVADARCTYTDTDGWIVPATDTHDGQHPNNAGGEKLYTELYDYLVPASGGGAVANIPLLGIGPL